MPKGCLFETFWVCLFSIGLGMKLDVGLDHEDSGYFIKPLFHGQELFSLNMQEKHFVVRPPSLGSLAVKASYGTLGVNVQVPPSLVQESLFNQSALHNSIVMGGLDISAHLVTRTITQDRPLLQVLFHASQSHIMGTTSANKDSKPHGKSDRWCLQVHAQKLDQELTSVCVISRHTNVCIAELTLPADWWDQKHTESADVFYSIYGIDQHLRCSSASNSIIPGKKSPMSAERIKTFLSAVRLTHGQMTYQELKEDQHILIHIPHKSFYPGSKFRVPVKLQAESDLQVFVIKIKAKRGLRVVGAEAIKPDIWGVRVEVNHKQHAGIVTASVQNKDKYTKIPRVQDIFDWVVEVEEDASGEDPGRLAMTLEYERSSQLRETYGTIENKVVARVEIQRDNTYTIVPVIKTTDIINTAILSGKTRNFPMQIYSVSHAGRITDITSQTTCHSGDDEVLKVAQFCDLVFLDGTESRGSPSVSVIAKFDRHTKFLFFRVWVPEVPLTIDLSDNKLSQVKGWKAPTYRRSSPTSSRKVRGADFGYLAHPNMMVPEEGIRKEDYAATCHLRWQSSLVEVYTRFYLPDGVKRQYLVHRKTLFRITDMVVDRLRIADTSIASVRGNVVDGLRTGRTEIQVMSRLGRPIGAKEVKVGNDKVKVEKLEVDVVADFSIDVQTEPQMPGTLVAKISRRSQLRKKHQVGLLDVRIKFSDGTAMPLSYIPTTEYVLDMDTMNNHVVAFERMLSRDTPRVVALGQGKGELLKISIELNDACQRKKTRPLAVSYVYVDVDFSKETSSFDRLQNDAGHMGYDNRGGQMYDYGGVKPSSTLEKEKEYKEGKKQKQPGRRKELGNVPPEIDVAQLDPRADGIPPNHEAQQQHITQVHGMTPLEIGMYVLLGVFCLAIVVFMANCMVFIVRYRKRYKPKGFSDTVDNANDWVWIGRATLERNAINTTCSQALMPEADFNGNHNSPNHLQLPASAPNSNRSSACSNGSNRNSLVSTYKGSECSIRITANPHPDANAEQEEGTLPSQAGTAKKQSTAAPAPAAPAPANSEEVSSFRLPSGAVPPGLDRLPPGACAGDISEEDWDYEAMGMTYDQLMEYFDNLKESTA